MERFSSDMIQNLYGNPHSGSASSQLATTRIEDIRLRALQFCKADPDSFDLVFVANATAGVKLVMDAFRSVESGYVYGYHKDSHTSLVGIRENAIISRCMDVEDVERWLSGKKPLVDGNIDHQNGLFSYPAQSNMNGRKLPLSWIRRARERCRNTSHSIYCLLDAAAFAPTSQIDLSDEVAAPDFTVLSFNKIFGFPDLGALIVRKKSGDVLRSRKYFGGGTVETVVCLKEQWHAGKEQSLHENLEDGTLPIHNIMALDSAMDVHRELFGTMEKISRHTAFLAGKLVKSLEALQHANGMKVCRLYTEETPIGTEYPAAGPTAAFNIRNSSGAWISNAEVEKLAAVRRIHIRTGGLCNPGGIASALDLSPWEMMSNFSAGIRCGSDNDIMKSGKPIGVIRTSLGAMSTMSDVERFIDFIKEFYVEDHVSGSNHDMSLQTHHPDEFSVESIIIYPIKSASGFEAPKNVGWEVKEEGLAWDREWCLVHQGSGQALSQKRYPKMALIQPVIDFQMAMLHVSYKGSVPEGCPTKVSVHLFSEPTEFQESVEFRPMSSRVCGDSITARTYTDKRINDFFTSVLGVPCALARFPAGGSGLSARHSKAHMQRHQRQNKPVNTKKSPADGLNDPLTPPDSDGESATRRILLSNESPILMINRLSLDALNKTIVEAGGKVAAPSVFRANIVIASSSDANHHQPYGEDHWPGLHIGDQEFKMLGSCRRCHMVCIDQDTAEKDEEPFVTLAKTRKFDGKVFFGSHMCHVPQQPLPSATKKTAPPRPTICVGDRVRPLI